MNIAKITCVCVVLLLALCVQTPRAQGRAGGGGSFHGSSGRSSGGGGSHSSGGGSSFHRSGRGGGSIGGDSSVAIVILVAIFVIIVFVSVAKGRAGGGGESRGTSSSSAFNDAPLAALERVDPAALLEADPGFSEARFYQRVQTAFVALQSAWSEQNLDGVRPFISDAIFERFTLQFDEQAFLGYINQMSDVQVQSVSLASVSSSGLYDSVTVKIRASAVDVDVRTDGTISRGFGAPQAFVEYWSFLRKRGAKSVQIGLMEGNCPNCGGGIGINQNAKCGHCQASLRGAQYDWVLTEITQAEVWERTREQDVPGVAEMQARDPNFTTADLEDRVSVVFWRTRRALRLGNGEPLRKVATREFIERYQAMFEPNGDGQRRCHLEVGVGSVATVGVRPGNAAEKRGDAAIVEIRWSGIVYFLEADGSTRKTSKDDLFQSWYVLRRDAACVTDASQVISSAHCPQCGAPMTFSASDACEYCNTPLSDGTHGWVLETIARRHDPEALALLQERGTTPLEATDS